jgi:hypothetical protein
VLPAPAGAAKIVPVAVTAETGQTTKAAQPPTMDRDEIIAMFREMSEVGSVELKMTVPPEQRVALAGLKIDFLQGRIREVYFFDTPDLRLFKHGVVLRARRTQGAPDDTVVKLRPARVHELAAKFRGSPNLKVEMDITKGSYVVSASLKGQRPVGAVQRAVAGQDQVVKLYSKEQRAYFEKYSPSDIDWDDVVALGPAYVVVLKHAPPKFGRKLTVEQWHYPGEVPLVEVSTKCAPGDAIVVAAETVEYLRSIGLTPSGEQAPKTRKALEFFASRLPS